MEPDGIGDRPHRFFRPGQEMPASSNAFWCVAGDIFGFGRSDIRRRVARIDADRQDRVIPPGGGVREIAEDDAANGAAAQIIEHQDDRLAIEKTAEGDGIAGFIDQLRGERQPRAGPQLQSEIGESLAPGPSGRRECREYAEREENGLHGLPCGKPSRPRPTICFIA